MARNSRNVNRKDRRASEAGQTTVFLVLVLGLFLLGGLCLAFDLSNMWFHRQSAQTAADAACTAGAMDLLVDAQGGKTGHQRFGTLNAGGTYTYPTYSCTTTSTDSVCQYAVKSGYNSNGAAPGNLVSVSFPASVNGVTAPPVGLAGTYPFIRVDVIDNVQTFFVGLLSGGTSAPVRAFATCGLELATAPIPLIVLDPRSTDGGNTGYAIWLRVISQCRALVPEYEISSEWDEVLIDLPHLKETHGRYKFGPLDYAATEVPNDQLERGLRFNFRGDMVEGVIIAYGFEAIPGTHHGAVSVRVTLMDALERTVQTDIELLVGERVSKRDQSPVRPGGGLHIPEERENTNAPTLPNSSAVGMSLS